MKWRAAQSRSPRSGPRHTAPASPTAHTAPTALIRPLGGSLTRLSDRASGVGLSALVLGTVALAVTGTAAAAGARDADVTVICLILLGAWSLLTLCFAASWRGAYRRCADDAHELLDIVDEIGAVVCVRDLEGRYLLVNRQFEQVYGVSRDDVLGRRHRDLFSGRAAVVVNDRKTLAQGTPMQTQETVDRIDGPHSFFTVRHPVTNRAGRAYAVCAISADITDLIRAESEVRTLMINLEKRVRDRTAELEASNRELDAFTYSVSHDLRAPLRTQAGFTEILLADHAEQLDQVGRDYLRRVHAAAEHMAGMMDALLDLSHVGRSELHRRPVDLGELARDILAELRVEEPGRDVEAVISRLPADGDPRLLGLVMRNLVSNAWRFTSERFDARINVGIRDSRGVCAYYVEDNGSGFDMTYADKLFTPFQRLHTTAQFPGTGIGLAIVERVIERHGGRVWAESTVGSGATFYFTLSPMSEQTSAEDRPQGRGNQAAM
jgi:PAS domain S-box-containing protein